MNFKIEWEPIFQNQSAGKPGPHQSTYRAKVPGGWLYRHSNFYKMGDDAAVAESMVFVPHPESGQ